MEGERSESPDPLADLGVITGPAATLDCPVEQLGHTGQQHDQDCGHGPVRVILGEQEVDIETLEDFLDNGQDQVEEEVLDRHAQRHQHVFVVHVVQASSRLKSLEGIEN